MDKDEALKLALEALKEISRHATTPWEDEWCGELADETLTAINALAQPAQEPVAWAVYDKRGGSKSLHWPEQHSPDGDANMFDAVPLVPQRPLIDLTDADWKEIEDMPDVFDQGVAWCLARLKGKNT